MPYEIPSWSLQKMLQEREVSRPGTHRSHWDRPLPSEGPQLHAGKNSRASHSKVRQVYLERDTLHRQSVGHL